MGSAVQLALWVTISFVLGAICSLTAGFVGMWISIRANIRTAVGSMKSINEGLQIARRGGTVAGLIVVAMNLLSVVGLYLVMRTTTDVDPAKIPFLIVE